MDNAEFAYQQQSQLQFYFSALGFKYSILLMLAAFFSFVLTLVVLFAGRGAWAVAALLFAVTLPVFVGIMGVFDGATMAMQVIARSTMTPEPAEVAMGASMALVSGMAGLFLATPSLLLALIGSMIRSFLAKPSDG